VPAIANIVMDYSIICLNFMAHTDKISVKMANIQAVSNAPHGSNSSGLKGIVAVNINTKSTMRQPSINRVQAVIVARALNFSGIFLPPIDDLISPN
jgi:hypothetical protein